MAQDASGPTMENSVRCSVSPGVDKDAYIHSSPSLDITAEPLMLVENGRVSSGVSTLDSPMDVQHDSAIVRSDLDTEFGCGFSTTPYITAEPISQLPYIVAFSNHSCSRASPPITPNSASSQIRRTPSPGQTDLSAFCVDDSPHDLPNASSLLTEPASATFVRPVSPLPPSSPGFINDCSMEFSDDAPVPPFPLPSSPVPSSSPPNFFTSSPTCRAPYKTPPTSPVPAENLTVVPSAVYSNPLKRPRSLDTVGPSVGDQNEELGEGPTKKKVGYARDTRIHDTHAVSRSWIHTNLPSLSGARIFPNIENTRSSRRHFGRL